MINMGKNKIICAGRNGIFLIELNNDYSSSNIIFHIMKDKQFVNLIKTYDNHFITYGKDISMWKWNINEEENNIDIKFILNDKNVKNICEISDKYFAYQTLENIPIILSKTFKEHLKIKYETTWFDIGINKLTDDIIGTISKDKKSIEFFNIQTGEKLYFKNRRRKYFNKRVYEKQMRKR